VPVEVYPSLAWVQLVRQRGSLLNIFSILDRVKSRAQISPAKSARRQDKLDGYLTSVREVRNASRQMRKAKRRRTMRRGEEHRGYRDGPARQRTARRSAGSRPPDVRHHRHRLSDRQTRVASLLISRDLSAMYYPFLGVKEGHHAASHNNDSDGYELIARFT